MQTFELRFVFKRQIDVNTLEIAPAVATAVEDLIVEGVDLIVVVRPELGFGEGIHPWMHACWHQPSAVAAQELGGVALTLIKF